VKNKGVFVMKNEKKNFEEAAKGEQPITARGLLEEIMPLLDDYFVGEISLSGGSITYILPNGQKFLITAELLSA